MTVQFERRTDQPDASGRCTIHLRAHFDGLPLLGGLVPAHPTADRGYDSGPLVATLAARGTRAVIPSRRKRRHPRAFDAARYAQRHPVERLFSRLKQFRRVATRHDKLGARFLAFIHLAATVLWLRECEHFLALREPYHWSRSKIFHAGAWLTASKKW